MDQKEIIRKNIEESKERIKEEIHKDNLVIFLTRIIEDLKRNSQTQFYGRLKDFYFLIKPYSEKKNLKEIFKELRESDFSSNEGLDLDDEEKRFIQIIISNLDEDCKFKSGGVMKGRINGMLNRVMKKYLPNSIENLEPYLIGKLISFFGGMRQLCFKPAGTIQLIGAERALFNYSQKSSPKYGILYYSKYVQQSENKGKEARKIANKLSISLRKDYFEYVAKS